MSGRSPTVEPQRLDRYLVSRTRSPHGRTMLSTSSDPRPTLILSHLGAASAGGEAPCRYTVPLQPRMVAGWLPVAPSLAPVRSWRVRSLDPPTIAVSLFLSTTGDPARSIGSPRRLAVESPRQQWRGVLVPLAFPAMDPRRGA